MDRPVGIIDVGSSAVKSAVFDVSTRRCILESDPVATRLGRGHRAGAPLPEEARQATLKAIEQFGAGIRAIGAAIDHVVATQAVRVASDREAFLSEIRTITGPDSDVRWITGEQESEWGYLSARDALDTPDAVLTIDPGGSSNDTAWGLGPAPEAVRSLAFGMNDVVVLAPPDADEGRLDEDARSRVLTFLREKYAPLAGMVEASPTPPRVVVTSGSAIAMAAVHRGVDAPDRLSRSRATHGVAVPSDAIDGLIASLAMVGAQERRERHPCISVLRAPIFVHGCLLYRAILDVTGADSVTINGYGMKWGAILASV